MWTTGWRDEVWSRLGGEWDLIVVGGGITGAGILAEAARKGVRALLVEAKDFASGTSSRSTKLVHGGLRYLRQAQIRLTRESVVERERLLREGGGLVTPLGFYLTSFEGDNMPGWMFGAGLALYDILGKKWAHKRFGKRTIIERCPPLDGAKLRTAYHYYDAQTDDARLVLRVLREAVRRGGTALNYARAESVLRDARGKVVGIAIADCANGKPRTTEVRAKVVINATGAWADHLRGEVGAKKKLRPIRGSHLIFPFDKLPLPEAVSLLHPRDGRAVFAVPWEGITLLGTTDVDHHDELEAEPRTSAREAEYLMEAAARAFPHVRLSLDDVRSSYSGVRGVIDTGQSDPSKESREHAIWREDGLLTVTGGKLTTFRLMAHEALHAVADALPEFKGRLARGRILDAGAEGLLAELPDEERARLAGRHGAEAADMLGAAGDLGTKKIDDTLALWAELKWAARNEGAVHLDDLLLRRVRLGLLAKEGGKPEMAKIRAVAQPELGWDDTRWVSEEARYLEMWSASYGTRFV
jgi:glycerol-3-phosphate dehydrogenase